VFPRAAEENVKSLLLVRVFCGAGVRKQTDSKELRKKKSEKVKSVYPYTSFPAPSRTKKKGGDSKRPKRTEQRIALREESQNKNERAGTSPRGVSSGDPGRG